jgi:Peptidase family M48
MYNDCRCQSKFPATTSGHNYREDRFMSISKYVLIGCVAFGMRAGAQQPRVEPAPPQTPTQSTGAVVTMDDVVNRAITREHALMDMLKMRTPLIETYLQDLKPDQKLGAVPSGDHYFLGRMDLSGNIDRRDYLSKRDSFQKNLLGGFTKLFHFQYQPLGFAWMIFADRQDFDRQHYDFKYVRREFLGDVRCLVFEVTPKDGTEDGRFLGRVWIEDEAYNIVRFNGTFEPRPKKGYFFHMDSWRLNLIPGYWIPVYVYSEEGDFSYGARNKLAFRAQSRIWGYDLRKEARAEELAQIRVDSVQDNSAAAEDASPLQAQREWQQQAEDNVMERLQASGLLAPEGEVDRVLQTVINNLEVTNSIDLPRPVRVRVLLTTPLETFSVGNVIVVSRGLIDTLPDEASLAMMLSHELAHIVLGHRLGSKFAFSDRLLFSDESTYSNFGFRHSPEEEAAADTKALELLKNSPYGQKLDTAALYMKQLSERAPQLPALLTAHLGNNIADSKGHIIRLPALLQTGAVLDPSKLDQIAALPLGGRVKINAWDDHVELIKGAPVAISSARDKMPFEVAPFFPHLTRFTSAATTENTPVAPATGAPTTTSPNN